MRSVLKTCIFLLVFLITEQTSAAQSAYYACDTASEYKKLTNYIKSKQDPSDQMIAHLRKELKQKYKHLSSKQRMQSKEFERDMKKAMREFRPTRPAKQTFACRKIPGNTILVEKNGQFSGIACVRASSWSTCKWTGRNALKARWTPTSDRKTWRRK
ncbi:hypothetical protein [uncultured Roseibium sp.]|uniref:hypothetical protein n=1 Tax=uncultured Roseibium sp. TaxID=1936171 RepID=UPI0026277C1D|nr:hypothetical protein [uncultured Roseibium sp.]